MGKRKRERVCVGKETVKLSGEFGFLIRVWMGARHGCRDGVLILLFYTAKGGVILFLKNLSSKLWQKRLKKMGSGTITRENFWGTKYDDGDYNSKMISAVIIYPCSQHTECWFHFSIQKTCLLGWWEIEICLSPLLLLLFWMKSCFLLCTMQCCSHFNASGNKFFKLSYFFSCLLGNKFYYI